MTRCGKGTKSGQVTTRNLVDSRGAKMQGSIGGPKSVGQQRIEEVIPGRVIRGALETWPSVSTDSRRNRKSTSY